MRRTLIILGALVGFALPALGQSSDAKSDDNAFKFKMPDDVKPEFEGGVKFRTEEDPASQGTTVFKVPVGYPKKEFLFSYNPGFNGFKNELAGTRTYNYGGGSPQNITAGLRYSFSAEDFFTVEANIQNVSVPHFDDFASGLTIQSSNVSLWSLKLQGNFYCSFYDSVNHKFCPGYQVTLDSFPSLEIPPSTNVDIYLTSVRDMTFGVGGLLTKPFIADTILVGRAFFDYGFGVGQSSALATKSNQRFNAQAGLEWPVPGRDTYVTVMGGFDYRRAVMKSTLDEWNITNISYTAMLGARWQFGQ